MGVSRWAAALLLSGCTVYNPAFLGSELPVIPVQPLDTVASSIWSAHGSVGKPLTYHYGENDKNELLSFGVYRRYSRAYRRLLYFPQQRGVSFAYGAMAYAGRYQAARGSTPLTTYHYHGGMLHGAMRHHLGGSERLSLVLETSASLFFEGGEYFREFNPVNQAGLVAPILAFFSLPLVASLQVSFMPHLQLNRHWSITNAYTAGLTGYDILSYYQFSGALAVSRQRFTLWSRAALHLSTSSSFDSPRWTVTTGLSYHFRTK